MKNKNVLVIGSGNDLTGRRLGKVIDAGRRWPVIVRCNKPYGAPADVGRRLDVLFIRFRGWQMRFWGEIPPPPALVAPNEYYNITHAEYEAIRAEIGCSHVSIGILAAAWCLNRGARTVSVIGFGCHGGIRDADRKVYASGPVDKNMHYNWSREYEWLKSNCVLL